MFVNCSSVAADDNKDSCYLWR